MHDRAAAGAGVAAALFHNRLLANLHGQPTLTRSWSGLQDTTTPSTVDRPVAVASPALTARQGDAPACIEPGTCGLEVLHGRYLAFGSFRKYLHLRVSRTGVQPRRSLPNSRTRP